MIDNIARGIGSTAFQKKLNKESHQALACGLLTKE